MANTMRWRYGDTNPVMLPVEAGVEVEIGDLLYLDSNNARPASAQSDQGSTVLNLQTFQDNFVGVAMQASPTDVTNNIRVATSGVFEFECDSGTFALGDALSVAGNLAGDAIFDQKVAKTISLASAIGRCAKQVTTASSRVLIDIVSVILKGGPQDRE